MSPIDTTGFFELAALLIPVLMLSGYVTQRLRPTPLWRAVAGEKEHEHLLKMCVIVVLFGLLPALSEITALAATLQGGTASGLETWLVATVVAFGTWTLAYALVWPWLTPVWNRSGFGRVVLVVGATVCIAMTGWSLRAGVENQRLGVVLDRLIETEGSSQFEDNLIASFELRERQLSYSLEGTHGKQRRRILDQIDALVVEQQTLLAQKAEAAQALDSARRDAAPVP